MAVKQTTIISGIPKKKRRKFKDVVAKEWQLYLFAVPTIVYLFIFHYVPMYGALIAFKDFRAIDGILGSDWVGLKYFIKFIHSYKFETVIINTIMLSFMQLVISFPMPIILALMLNQVKNYKYKKFVQTVTYSPHFISMVVMVGMLFLFLSPNTGLVNTLIKNAGGDPIHFMAESDMFRWIYVLSGVWQSTGYGTIIYMAALASVSTELYDSARIDGCGKFNLIRYIDLPHLYPTMIILFILQVGKIMNVGFQKAYLMQNPLNQQTSEIISTYVYKVGLIDQQYSYSTAIGIFNSIINIILLISINQASKKLTKTSLW